MAKRKRCKAKTKSGKRCSNVAKHGCAGYCGLHYRLIFNTRTVGLCIAKTKNGRWCRNKARENYSGYCGVHHRLAAKTHWQRIGRRSKKATRIMIDAAGIAAFIRLLFELIRYFSQLDLFRDFCTRFLAPCELRLWALTPKAENQAGEIYTKCQELMQDLELEIFPSDYFRDRLNQLKFLFNTWLRSLDTELIKHVVLTGRFILKYREDRDGLWAIKHLAQLKDLNKLEIKHAISGALPYDIRREISTAELFIMRKTYK